MFQFGEASRLYAENLSVVREMQKAFAEDLKEFFGQLSETVRLGAEPLTVSSLLNGTSWYWWSGPAEWDQDRVKVWCTWSDSAIITDGHIPFYVGAASLDPLGQERVAALATSLSMWNRPKKTTPWRALQVDANWGAADDPIELAAAPVIAALRALDGGAPSAKKKR